MIGTLVLYDDIKWEECHVSHMVGFLFGILKVFPLSTFLKSCHVLFSKKMYVHALIFTLTVADIIIKNLSETSSTTSSLK